VAIAVALLFPAMLLNRSLTNLLSVDPGFSPNNALTVQLHFSSNDGNPDHRMLFLMAIRDRLRTANGVLSAGLTTSAPLSGHSVLLSGALRVFPGGEKPPVSLPTLDGQFVTAGYVDAMGLRLIQGRDLSDNPSSHEVIVDDSFARRLASAAALGATVRWRNATYTVVGVVRAIHDFPSTAVSPTIYFPIQAADELPWAFVVARVQGRVDLVGEEIVRGIQAVNPTACISDAVSLDNLLKEKFRPRRRVLSLSLLAAGVALSLSLLSLHLAVQHVVVARRREIAIRTALGAPLSARLLVIGRHFLWPLIAGGLLGGFGGYGIALLLRPQLYRAAPADAPGIMATVAVMCAVAVMAALKPVIDAWRLDTVATLREL
jgi:predicted lysophospholipase L1 biosynthesis ABC-type transport system permease subunit